MAMPPLEQLPLGIFRHFRVLSGHPGEDLPVRMLGDPDSFSLPGPYDFPGQIHEL